MAPGKSPAFQFYANDFLAGTLTLSLEECGAYITLLAYQWDTGSVPTGAAARARICRCSIAQAKRIWVAIEGKFEQGPDGLWRNARLESERQKQDAYRELQRYKGLASARNRATNRTATEPQPSHQPNGQPEGNQQANRKPTLLSSSSSSSSRSGIETGSPKTTHRGVGLIVGGGEYHRLLETNAYVGTNLRVPKVLHAELIAKSGANADAELRTWYATLDEDLEQSGKGTGDVFAWLRPRHQAFAMSKGWIDAAPRVDAKPKPEPFSIEKALANEAARKAGRS